MNEDRVFLIAEIAQTHDGSLGTAIAYVDALAKTGVDAVKFQTHYAEEESTQREPWRVKFSFQDASRFDYWRRMEFTPDEWKKLAEYCQSKGIIFLSSPFSLKAVEVLQECNIAAWKIGSGEISNDLLISKVASTGKPVLVSTGMSDWGEIDEVCRDLQKAGAPFALLHCTSEYPVTPEHVGLNVIEEFKKKYNCVVGFSSHVPHVAPLYAAVAKGARILEFHACFSRECFGPDVSSSLEVEEIHDLVKGVRMLEGILNHPVDKNSLSQKLSHTASIFRKSIVASKDLKAGTVLELSDLGFKKPGDGLPVKNWKEMIGKKLKQNKMKDELIQLDDLERR